MAVHRRIDVLVGIQYLTLDKSYAEKPKFEGAKYVMSPPLRDKRNQEVLWNGLRDGLIQTVATDHCPFDFKTHKPMGRADLTKIPNGIPSLEERINLLYTYGVKAGKIDLHTFVDVASTRIAKLFGLFPRKGTIQPSADADLVVFDPDYRGKISAKTQHMNVDYSAFEGWKIEGRPSVVTVRGIPGIRSNKAAGEIIELYRNPEPLSEADLKAIENILATWVRNSATAASIACPARKASRFHRF